MSESIPPSSTPAPAAAPEASAAGATAPAKPGWLHRLRPATAATIVIAVLLAWNWYDSRSQVEALREEVARRLRDSDVDSRDARTAAKQVQEAMREAQGRLSQLEAKLAESQSQQLALEALYQELSRSRDEWALAEIEQILTIASQQLQLAGNVQAALVALQTADSRLARSDRPQFIPLRRVLAKDIDRLRNTPNVDTVGIALKLDQTIAAADSLPLMFDQRMSGGRAEAAPKDDGVWARLGAEIWGEIRGLVRVRNLERPDAPLLPPSEAYFLRQNLKLRLLNARLALLERNETVFRADVQASVDWINRYFDARSRPAVAALATLRQISASGLRIDVPAVSESLAAVRNFKLTRERAAK